MKKHVVGTRLEFNVKLDEKILIQNLMRRKLFEFKNLALCFSWSWKSDLLYFFNFKIWRNVFFSENLTRCLIFNSKTDKLQSLHWKSDFWNDFSDSPRKNIKVLPTSKSHLLEHDNHLGLKAFSRVCSMCLSHIWYYFIGYCVPIWQLGYRWV